MRKTGLLVLLIAASVHAQVARPPTGPTTTPAQADAAAAEFTKRGIRELDGGNNEAAVTTFTDGLKQYGPITGSSTNDSAPKVVLNHGLAVAHLRLNQMSPAKQAIDRATGARWTNDSLIWNAATIAVVLKSTAIQAVTALDPYLASHPDADESWVNLYGLALERAAIDAASRTQLEARFKSLETYQARLEAKNPGKKRWGSAWLDEAEWKETQTKVDESKKQIADLQAKVDQAEQRLQQQAARQTTPRANTNTGGGGGGGRRRGGGGSATPPPPPARSGGQQPQANTARQALTDAEKNLEDAIEKAPKPTWNVLLIGIIPEVEMVREEAPRPASRPATRATG